MNMETILNFLKEKGVFPCSILFNDAEGNDCTLKSVSIENDTVIFNFEDFLCMEQTNTLEEVLNSSYAQIWDIVGKEIQKAIEFAKHKSIEVEKTAIPAINVDAIARLTGNKESFEFAAIPRELWGYAVQTWEAMELGKEYAYTIVSVSENLTFTCKKRECGLVEKIVGKSKKGNDVVERVRKPSLEVLLQVDSIPKHVLSSFSKLEQAQKELALEQAKIKAPRNIEKTSCIMTAKNFLAMLKKAEGLYKTEASFFKESAQIMMYSNGTYFSGLSNMQGEDVAIIETNTWQGANSMLIPLNMDRTLKLSNMVTQLPNCNLEIFNAVETYEDNTTIQRFYFTSPFGQYEVALDIADNALFTVEQLNKNATIDTTCSMQIQASEFRGAINTCSNFVSKDDLRPAICGVYVDMFANKFVATNAHVLVVVPMEMELLEGSEKQNFILPIEEVKAFLATIPVLYNGYVVIELKGIFAKLSCGNSSSIVRLIQANYPDYNAVMPTNNDNNVSILKSDLQKSLRRIKPFCNSSAPTVSLSFSQNCLTLSGSNATVCTIEKFDSQNGAIKKEYRYKNEENITTKEEFFYTWQKGIDTVQVETIHFLNGDTNTEMMPCFGALELSVSFNVDYLLSCINVGIEDNVCLNLNSSPHRGSLIESKDKTILIMPVMVEKLFCPPNTTKIHQVECMADKEEEFEEDMTDAEVEQYEEELGK